MKVKNDNRSNQPGIYRQAYTIAGKKDKNTHKWNLALEALYLWAEWFEKEGSPKIYGVAGVSCFFCKGAARPGHEIRHKPDCIYRRAKELVDEAKELPE